MKELWLNSILFSDADVDRFVRNLNDTGASDVVVVDDRNIGGSIQIRFKISSKSEVSAIADMKEVRWIEEVPEIIEDNTNATGTIQSGTADNRTIWDRGLHGEGQIIGITDSGDPDMDHCFFRQTANTFPLLETM
jgi:hypothetical protein